MECPKCHAENKEDSHFCSNCAKELVRLKDLLEDDNNLLRDEMHRMVGDEIVGAQFGLRGVVDLVRKVAPLGSPVLLLGETGSGNV